MKESISIGGSEKNLLRAVKSGVAVVVTWNHWKPAPALKLIDVVYSVPCNGEGHFRCLVSARIARKMGIVL